MNVYIWKRRKNMTSHWHPEGGAVAVAATLDEAKARLVAFVFSDPEGALTSDPDLIYELAANELPYAEVFPDAGCC